MTRTAWIVSALIVVALIGGGLVAKHLVFSGASVTSTIPKPSPPTARERRLLVLINVERKVAGLKALVYDPVMAKVARDHTADMVKRNYFSHDEPNGRSFAERVHYVLVMPGRRAVGENIALGSGSYGTPQALVTAWMNSPGHRANILNRAYGRTGFGAVLATKFQGFAGVVVATESFSN